MFIISLLLISIKFMVGEEVAEEEEEAQEQEEEAPTQADSRKEESF